MPRYNYSVLKTASSWAGTWTTGYSKAQLYITHTHTHTQCARVCTLEQSKHGDLERKDLTGETDSLECLVVRPRVWSTLVPPPTCPPCPTSWNFLHCLGDGEVRVTENSTVVSEPDLWPCALPNSLVLCPAGTNPVVLEKPVVDLDL